MTNAINNATESEQKNELVLSKEATADAQLVYEQQKELEDVDRSLKKVLSDRPKKKQKWYSAFFTKLFFPFAYIYKCISGFAETKLRQLKLTTKMTVLLVFACTVMIAVCILFLVVSLRTQIKLDRDPDKIIRSLEISGIILMVIFAVLLAIFINTIVYVSIVPVKKITEQIEGISADDMQKRLSQVDSQEEIVALVKQINKTLDDLENSFDRQNNFVSDASHELKTPLAVINGYADLLSRWGKDDPAILAEAIEAISREAKFMEKLTKQLLLLARLGKFNLSPSKFDLGKVAKETVESYRVLNYPHDITCSCEKAMIFCDKNLVTEALRTLIDNAIKYTAGEGGKIKVTVKSCANAVSVSVEDNGAGISEADKDKIFDRFYRCDKARGREQGSSGLGLSICKSIVENSGGKISVKSTLGKGSVFTIVLPKK